MLFGRDPESAEGSAVPAAQARANSLSAGSIGVWSEERTVQFRRGAA
jgi:hypothetical protein